MFKSLILFLALFPTSGFAHIGDHTHIDVSAFLKHLFETDHLIMIGMAAIAGFLALRHNRKARRTVVVKKEDRHEPR